MLGLSLMNPALAMLGSCADVSYNTWLFICIFSGKTIYALNNSSPPTCSVLQCIQFFESTCGGFSHGNGEF